MNNDPGKEWQRLTGLYSEMSDGELDDLAANLGDLTEIAQQVLRDERKKRGMKEPEAQRTAEDNQPSFGRWSRALAEQNVDSDSESDGSSATEEDGPVEYSWKTLLCECDGGEEVQQIFEVLRLAGIQAWKTGPSSYFGSQTTKILVAADQLEEARQVIARPIPQDIVDQSKMKVEDFEVPPCPKCGASDPLLESVEPANTWRCESCGAEWMDAEGSSEARAPQAAP